MTMEVTDLDQRQLHFAVLITGERLMDRDPTGRHCHGGEHDKVHQVAHKRGTGRETAFV